MPRFLSHRIPGLVLVGLAGLASACAPTGARYTLVPAGEPTVTEPAVASPAAPTGDAQLDAFLAELASEIDRHDWRAIALRLEGPAYADLYEEAIAAGASPETASAALIARALGLEALATDLAPSFASLNRIEVVTLRSTEGFPGNVIRVAGDVRLEDDARLPLTAFVQRAPDTGRFKLILSRT